MTYNKILLKALQAAIDDFRLELDRNIAQFKYEKMIVIAKRVENEK